MTKYNDNFNKAFERFEENEIKNLCDNVDELLGGDKDHQTGDPYLKSQIIVYHLLDRMIHSDGLRRAIKSDFEGESTDREIAKNLLYMTLLVGHTTQEEIDEVFKALEQDKDSYESDEEDED